MIIVDKALERREQEGNPIRVAIVGAGYLGRGIALQIVTATVGMELVAVSNRTISEAERAYRQAGVESVKTVGSSLSWKKPLPKASMPSPMMPCCSARQKASTPCLK